jgi:hypothetical protein
MGQLGNLVPPKCMFMLGDHISTSGLLNCEKQQKFTSKIWFNLEPDSGTTGNLGNLVPPKSTFIVSDHISTTTNPWQECAALNCQNQQNFASKIWFNLELGSGTMGQLGNLMPPQCMFMLGDHIPPPQTLGRSVGFEIAKISRILVQKFGSISNQIQVLWVNWEI